MTPQHAFGDDEGAERHHRGRDQREPVEPHVAAPPRDAAHEEQRWRRRRAGTAAVWSAGFWDRGDRARPSRPQSPMAPQRLTMELAITPGVIGRSRGAAASMPKARLSSIQWQDRKHQALQRQHGGGGEQRRQRARRHFAEQIAPGAGEIDAADLQEIVAPGVIEFAGAERVVSARRDVLARRRRIFSARRSRRYRHPVMTKRASSKPASSPTPNTLRCWRMMPRASCRCAKLWRAPAIGRGKHVGKGLADHAADRRHLRDVGNPSRPQAVAHEQHQRGEAVQHPGQPLPLHVGVDHDEAEMGDLGRLAVEFDRHHRQRVEGDRMSGRLLAKSRVTMARDSRSRSPEKMP